MKEEWKEIRLGKIATIKSGKTKKEDPAGSFPIFGSNGIIGMSKDFNCEDKVIIGRVGAYCGSINYYKDKFWATDNTLIFDVDKQNDILFFKYYLSNFPLNELAGGAAQPLLTQGLLKNLKLTLPPLQTQRKIAFILSAYDDLIENNLKRIAILEEMAQQTFTTFFNKEESKEWKKTALNECIEFHIGGGWGAETESDEFSNKGYVIRGTDINPVSLGDISNVPLRFHKKSNFKSRKLEDGDIIFEVSGGSSSEGVAKSLLITKELLSLFDNDVMCASFCKLMRPKESKFSHYLYFFLQYLRNKRITEVYEKRSASNIVNYNWEAFLKYQEIIIPSATKLEEFNDKVVPLKASINNLGKQNQRLREARDILLPRLMMGMIDVEEVVMAEVGG